MAELVFLHGAADSASVWEHQLAYFSDRGHRLLGVDLPGHGARLTEQAYDRIEQSAQAVVRLIRAKQLTAPVLVGHSMGGGIALTIALTEPSVPRALVLAGSGARLRMRPEQLEEARLRADSTPPGVRIARVIPLDQVLSPNASAETQEWLRQRFGQATAQATYGDFLATHHTDLLERVQEVQLPVLVIGGEDDRWTPPRFQHYLAEHLPNARLIMLPETGHYPFVERPDRFNAEVEQFLEGLT